MTRKITTLIVTLVFSLGVSTSALAISALADDGFGNIIGYGFNIDGAITDPFFGDPIPSEVDDSGFNYNTGLGNIDVTITGGGSHNFVAFFDHEFDKAGNTFFNEFGSVSGTPAAGQSWEIDEPVAVGDIFFFNFFDGTLDNSNNNGFFDTSEPDDISMAMGWNFTLALGEEALISLALGTVMPTSGFFQEHNDPNSNESVFFSSTLNITGPSVPPVPVPAAIWLFASGIIGLVGFSRCRSKN